MWSLVLGVVRAKGRRDCLAASYKRAILRAYLCAWKACVHACVRMCLCVFTIELDCDGVCRHLHAADRLTFSIDKQFVLFGMWRFDEDADVIHV